MTGVFMQAVCLMMMDKVKVSRIIQMDDYLIVITE